MKNRKILLPILLSVALILSLILPASVAGASVTVHRPDDRSISHLAVDSSSAASAMALNTPQGQVTPMVAVGGSHTVGLKGDGTVVAVGDNDYGQLDVGVWTDIVQVAAGRSHTTGLKDDGTVVAAGPEIALAKWNLGVIEYVLTISSTAGGSVATPDEGVFTYNAGVMVRVVAEPEAGYRFVNWSGDVDTIARVSAAITIITIHGDYSITANFEEKPPINWLLIGGIIAAVVIVGLVIFLVRRKRAT